MLGEPHASLAFRPIAVGPHGKFMNTSSRRISGEVRPSSRARRVEELVHKRKLIEVALPLEAINRESAREKSIRHGHPSTLHLWWARRPLAAARAVLFAQLVDDPSRIRTSSRPRSFNERSASACTP